MSHLPSVLWVFSAACQWAYWSPCWAGSPGVWTLVDSIAFDLWHQRDIEEL